VAKITESIKTLILEIVSGNGSCHIREIHLQVTELRPEVPQHTVRARLSEMSRSESLDDKLRAFETASMDCTRKTKSCAALSLTRQRPVGRFRLSWKLLGYLVKDLILRFGCKSVFDPAEGSGTVRDVVAGINQFLKKGLITRAGT